MGVVSHKAGGCIECPFKVAEANIQAEFYHFARLHNLQCLLEFRTPCGRHDITVFNPDFTKLMAIVECKVYVMGNDTKQLRRYRRVGVKVFTLFDCTKAERLVISIKDQLGTMTGVLVSELDEVVPIERRRKWGKETE